MGMLWGILSRSKDAIKKRRQQSLVLLFMLRMSMCCLFVAFCFPALSVAKSHAGSMTVMCVMLEGLHGCSDVEVHSKAILFCSGPAAIISIRCANE